MPLGFLVPAVLAGLLALAVPLFLHLRQRERQRPTAFPSLMFLARVPIRTDRRKRITDLPLLLLRALAVALLVSAFARPYLGRDIAAGAGDPGLTVIAVDRSQSMGHGAVRERLRDSLTAVLAAVPAGGRIAVVGYDATAEVLTAPTADRGVVAAALAAATPRAAGTRHWTGVRAAAQLLASEPVPGALVMVTDLQAGASDPAGAPALPAGTSTRVVSVAAPLVDNAAVIATEIEVLAAGGERRAAIGAELTRQGGDTIRQAHVELLIDGRRAATSAVALPRAGRVRVVFDTVALPRGAARVEVRLPADALPADDVFHAMAPADDALRVVLVSQAPSAGVFVSRALGIGRDPVITVERVAAVDAATLSRATVLWWHDVPPPGGAMGDAIAEWVAAGGGLVLGVGAKVGASGTRLPLLPAVVGGTTRRQGATVGAPARAHPALAPFRDLAADPLGTVRIRRQPRLEPRPAGRTVLSFDDGAPAMVTGTEGLGQVAVIGIPLDLDGGDFPLQSTFLPFVRGVALWAGGRGMHASSYTAGEVWQLPGALGNPEVRSPSGVRLPVQAGAAILPPEAGFHQVRERGSAGAPVATVGVNAPAAEASRASLVADDVWLGVEVAATAATTTVQATPRELEARQGSWRWLLLIALLVMAAESWLASRGWRGHATAAAPRREGGG